MRIGYVAAVMVLIVIGPSKTSFAVNSTVRFSAHGQADSRSDAFPGAFEFLSLEESYFPSTDEDTAPIFASETDGATANSPHGSASIHMEATGYAQFFEHFSGKPNSGRLGAGFTVRLLASNPGVNPAQPYVQRAVAELREIRVTAEIDDQVLVYSPNVPIGTPFRAHGNFQLTGYLAPAVAGDPVPYGGGFAETWVILQGGGGSKLPPPIFQQYYGYSRVGGLDESPETYEPQVSVPYDFQVVNGHRYDLSLRLIVGGRGSAAREHANIGVFPAGEILTQVAASYTNTLTWGGITGVTNELTGEPVQNWTITADSGFDYTRSYIIPEPSTISLLLPLLGVAAYSPVRRRELL